MAIMVECPQCRKRNSLKEKTCKGKNGNPCGFNLAKFSGKVYWVTVRDIYNKQVWERIGPNKAAAEYRERELLTQRAEGRVIKKSPDAITTFNQLTEWYLDLPETKAKKSLLRDQYSVRELLPHFGDKLLKDIAPSMVESYKQKRLGEQSYRKQPTKPATVNREITCLKVIFNKAVKDGRAENNPAKGVKLLKENNERDRILSDAEYIRLLAACSDHLKPIVKAAYHTAMRQGEILNLTWGQVDLKEGFIILKAEHTKTNDGRLVPLNQEMLDMFKAMVRGLPKTPVFTYEGNSIASVKRSFTMACKRAEIEDFTFHDLRHCCINNWRQAGHDYFRIMEATGHKTMEVFKRYNTVSKDELKTLVGVKI